MKRAVTLPGIGTIVKSAAHPEDWNRIVRVEFSSLERSMTTDHHLTIYMVPNHYKIGQERIQPWVMHKWPDPAWIEVSDEEWETRYGDQGIPADN